MLWKNYVLRRGTSALSMWDQQFGDKKDNNAPTRLLYIAGMGFDLRAQKVMSAYVQTIMSSQCRIENAELLLLELEDYQLAPELTAQTDSNARALEETFSQIGSVKRLLMPKVDAEEEITPNQALNKRVKEIVKYVTNHTDIVLDVSSLPRVTYLSIMLGILSKLVPDKSKADALSNKCINFQVLVGEDSALDRKIRGEEPSGDWVLVTGYSRGLLQESTAERPCVWFPILGEGRLSQLELIMNKLPDDTEICPVLPHPSKNPRRGDDLLIEYKAPLFDTQRTPITNIMYVHESNPFEVYRQLFEAMNRYRKSLKILDGCTLVVTPLASKLITIGAGLACFNMKNDDKNSDYDVALPHAALRRYTVNLESLTSSQPEINVLWLTGDAYSSS